jgi:hypothetical protein
MEEAGEFGRYGGDEVANKDSVLGQLDRLLNKGEPPDLELIFILPFPVRPPYVFSFSLFFFYLYLFLSRTGRSGASQWRTRIRSDI